MKKRTKKLLLLTLILAIVSVSLSVFIFFQIRDINRSAYTILEDIVMEQNKARNLTSLRGFVEDISESKELIDSYFVNSNQIIDFIEYVEDFDQTANTQTILELVNIERDNNKAKLNLAFRSAGSFSEVYHLLELLESMPYKIEIDRVNLVYLTSDQEEFASAGDWRGDFFISLLSFEEI